MVIHCYLKYLILFTERRGNTRTLLVNDKQCCKFMIQSPNESLYLGIVNSQLFSASESTPESILFSTLFIQFFFHYSGYFTSSGPNLTISPPTFIIFYPIFMSHNIGFRESFPFKRSCQFTTLLKKGSKNRFFNSQLLNRWDSTQH